MPRETSSLLPATKPHLPFALEADKKETFTWMKCDQELTNAKEVFEIEIQFTIIARNFSFAQKINTIVFPFNIAGAEVWGTAPSVPSSMLARPSRPLPHTEPTSLST